MTLDPRIAVWLSLLLAVLAFLAGAGTYFADLGLSEKAVKAILAGIALTNGIGNSILAVLSAIPSKSDPDSLAKFYLGPKQPK